MSEAETPTYFQHERLRCHLRLSPIKASPNSRAWNATELHGIQQSVSWSKASRQGKIRQTTEYTALTYLAAPSGFFDIVLEQVDRRGQLAEDWDFSSWHKEEQNRGDIAMYIYLDEDFDSHNTKKSSPAVEHLIWKKSDDRESRVGLKDRVVTQGLVTEELDDGKGVFRNFAYSERHPKDGQLDNKNTKERFSDHSCITVELFWTKMISLRRNESGKFRPQKRPDRNAGVHPSLSHKVQYVVF